MNMLARAALLLSVLFACAPAMAQWDSTLSALPAATTITGAEVLPVYQGGAPVATTLTAACSSHVAVSGVPTLVGLPGAATITGAEIIALYQGRHLVASSVTAVCSSHVSFAGAPTTVGIPGAGALTGPELVPMYQGGRRVLATIDQITTFAGGAPAFTNSLDHSDARNSFYL